MKRKHLETIGLILLAAVAVALCYFVPPRLHNSDSTPSATHGHSYIYISDPTCTEQGYTTYACSCGDSYVADYVPALTHEFIDSSCQNCGALSDEIAYTEIDSAEDIYALSRILAPEQIKGNIYGAGYDVNQDLSRFEYPGNITDVPSKIEYLSTAAYKLTSDVSLTIQQNNDVTYFLGIGSTEYPFKGIFNGNGKTVTLNSNGIIALNSYDNHQIGLFGNIQNAKIANVDVNVNTDILVNKCLDVIKLGVLAGFADKSQISNCNVAIANSKVGVNFHPGETDVHKAHIGGIVGESSFTIIRNSAVNLTDATLMAQGYDVSKYESMYAYFSVGGILGFSEPGSDNTNHIGRIGNQLVNCNVVSINEKQHNVIFASVLKGDEVTAGGLVGCTFNNFIATNCSVNISNGNIVAQKTGTTDTAIFGTNAGGIVGRLEHTGELYNCSVNGDYMNIISCSPENYSTAGGIVGFDVGPYHRDVVSINKCSINGNGTSKIILIIKADPSINKWNALGGIAGGSSYQIADCTVKDVTLVNKSEDVDKIFIGGFCGIMNYSHFWRSGEYFEATKATGVNGCTSSGLKFDAAVNAVIKEEIGFMQYKG